MSDSVITGIITILTAVIGIAIVSVLVSKQADTANVLTAGGKAFGGILTAALGPVSGGGNNGLPSLSFGAGY